MKRLSHILSSVVLMLAGCTASGPENIPLPEHPRPDFEREAFVNLNGRWNFTFDEATAIAGLEKVSSEGFDKSIMVPFPWGSKLSEVEDGGDIAWYGRNIKVPSSWKGKRIFVTVGASDWETTAWIDGQELGKHSGGYTPFEFEITDYVRFGSQQTLFFKVDDTYADWHQYGKQGYGNARGIWQTVYLEARGDNFIKTLHFSPDIEASCVNVSVTLDGEAAEGSRVELAFRGGERETFSIEADGQKSLTFDVPLPDQHLWDLEDPYLYEVTASLVQGSKTVDAVDSYFGQRSIGTVQVPGQDFKYVSLNGKPIYLKLCLDQSYHPEGFYTFPSDEFMKNEIMLSKKLGLNGNRIHIKAELPRKLYWADKLGLLVMADIPNYWGEPGPEAREAWETEMRAQVERDYNHPSIFAWVDFNETWGLFSKENGERKYSKDTQEWVRSMYKLTKSLDPTRLVEDNSACNEDHVQTDINSWHGYYPGYKWENIAASFDEGTFPGSELNYTEGNLQNDVPMINSECGNVWGYKGSAGDCDFTWDYHEMMNAFHRHLKIGGWLYTEHHDVINEWNGYVRFDRSEKFYGLEDLVPGMDIADFHSNYYIVYDGSLCRNAEARTTVTLPIMSSFTTDKDPGELTLYTELAGINSLGEESLTDLGSCPVPFNAFCVNNICNKEIKMPAENGIYVLRMVLKNESGDTLHRNFALLRVIGGEDAVQQGCARVTFAPKSFTASAWSTKQSEVMDGLKVNGFGSGFFEYSVDTPDNASGAKLLIEVSAKQLLGKDIEDGETIEGDFMLGGGTYDPCKNPNAYAMTDTAVHPSKVSVSVNGIDAGTYDLADDPADHRGILSWNSQLKDSHLREAGSYGYLLDVKVPQEAIAAGSPMVVRLSVSEDLPGGLAIYGKDFGRYPLDPTVIFTLAE